VWQTIVGTWDGGPIALDRLGRYLEKATREAKRYTGWTSPDPAYDDALQAFARSVLADGELMAGVEAFCALLDPVARVVTLGQKLVQLTMPGVPDVYQGCESVDLSLVDPDNRRDVDFDDRRARLARLDSGAAPVDLDDAKLLVTSRALRVRREHPDWFVGPASGYAPVATTTGNAVAFARGPAPASDEPAGGAPSGGLSPSIVTVVTRLPVALERHGGWGDHAIFVPDGQWRDALTGTVVPGGECHLADLLAVLPVALLVRSP
jgi:(1->4)-alpha-D-glucan 1-alpha-D-glucosylmutase